MEKQRLRKELIQKISECEDAAVLKRVEEILIGFSEVREGSENYTKEVDPVPANYYEKLEEDFQKYKKGEIKGISWEEFREEIRSKHGF